MVIHLFKYPYQYTIIVWLLLPFGCLVTALTPVYWSLQSVITMATERRVSFPYGEVDSNWFQDDRGGFGNHGYVRSSLIRQLERKSPLIAISADSNIGKTCLLFQTAVSYASKGVNVTYICKNQFSQMPYGVHGMPKPDTKVLDSVRFWYMAHVDELVQYCSTIHTRVMYPEVILVDNIDEYIEQLQDTSLDHSCARICALLIDMLHFINLKKTDCAKCHLLVTFKEKAKVSHLQHVFKKFGFDVADLSEAEGDKSYMMTIASNNCVLHLSYFIHSEEIFLKHIQVSEEKT